MSESPKKSRGRPAKVSDAWANFSVCLLKLTINFYRHFKIRFVVLAKMSCFWFLRKCFRAKSRARTFSREISSPSSRFLIVLGFAGKGAERRRTRCREASTKVAKEGRKGRKARTKG